MEEKYLEEFQKMGIQVEPLPSNYDPDVFGRMLLNNVIMQDVELSYSNKTQELNRDLEIA